MLRAFYVVLLRLHPSSFRQQFADEMLWIFDQSTSLRATHALFADVFRSLATQWIFRSDFENQPQLAGAVGPAADRVPVFYTAGSEIPPASALLNGLILSVGVFAFACFLLMHSGRGARVFTYYGNDFHAGPPSSGETTAKATPGFWSKLTFSLRKKTPGSAGETPSTVANRAPAFDSGTPGPNAGSEKAEAESGNLPGPIAAAITAEGQSRMYFRLAPILAALDTDHNGELSAEEIATAPDVLLGLDKNHDGKLDAEECGLRLPPPATPVSLQNTRRARLTFMRVEPVLAALDANHDGDISMSEISNAPAVLKGLDQNHDGRLTLDEVAKEPVQCEVAAIFNLDINFDDRLSRRERSNSLGRGLRFLFADADRNHDGFVTWDELSREILFRADFNHDGKVTWEEMMVARKHGAFMGRP